TMRMPAPCRHANYQPDVAYSHGATQERQVKAASRFLKDRRQGQAMDIISLKLVMNDRDINDLLTRFLPPNQPVEDVRLAITPEGVVVSGVYPLFINVRFETTWELGVVNGAVAARLAHLKAMGVPGNILKSAIVKLIEDQARGEPWLRRDGDTLLIDAEAA